LVLAERLDDVGMEQPTEYDECPKCGGPGEVRGWLVDPLCPDCGGNGTVSRPNSLRDWAELIRVQVERGQLFYTVIRKCTGEEASTIPDPVVMRHAELGRREHDLIARNPAWLSVPPVAMPATITRGFLDVTLPRALCWQEVFPNGCPRCGGSLSESLYCPVCRAVTPEGTTVEPHPVLRAVLAPPVGPWVRRVWVEGREPFVDHDRDSAGWQKRSVGMRVWHGNPPPEREPYLIPDPVFDLLGGEPGVGDSRRFPTAEAAADALSLAVPRWARGAK
jgi:hypothetical protein